MSIANRQRGEVSIEGPDGKKYRLCLTLGAIAQIEEELGVESLTQIDTVMGKGGMREVLSIFIALLNGGGHTEIERSDMIHWDVPLVELTQKIGECFRAAGFGLEEGGSGDEDPKS